MNKMLAAAAVLALFVGGTCFRPAVAQNNWIGTTSSDYFTASNWSTGALPLNNQAVRFGLQAFTNAAVYDGDNSATPTNDFEIYGNNNGVFTMNGGTLVAGDRIRIGHSSAPTGMATLNMVGGEVQGRAPFNTSTQTGAMATFNMSGGSISIAASDLNNSVTFANFGNGINRPNTITTANVSGGTLKTTGRIIFGSNNSGSFGDATLNNARVEMTMTGGLLWAAGPDGVGTLQFAGGSIDLSGGIIKGGDISTRDGWNRSAYGGTGGTNFRGGVVQIDTNVSEGTLFVVPQGVDPVDVVGTPLNRGQSRAIFATAAFISTVTVDGVPVEFPAGERFHTTVPNSTVRVWMDTSGPVAQANAFATPKGDYNLDGVVNRADYLLWQNQLGNTYLADNLDPEGSKIGYYGADGNGDGVVTQADFDVWAASIGQAAVGGPYVWAQARSIDVASGSQTQAEAGYPTLTFTTASSVTKTGGGTLVMDAANTYTGPTNVNAGTVQVANPLALQSSPVTVQTGGRLALPGDVRITVPVGNLSVNQAAGGGIVDVGVGEIDVFRGLSEADLRADIIAGRSGGSWAGATGITSSAAASSGGTRAVGYVMGADGSSKVSFAAAGDVDLSGAVNVFDLVSINSSGRYGTGAASGWGQGDFNYDGVTNVFDLVGVNTAGVYGQGNYFPAGPGIGATGGVTAVPEPAAGLLSLAAIVATGIAVRRRKPAAAGG